MKELKKTFDAARSMYGHSSITQAANHMGYSKTTIDRFFRGDLPYTDKVETAVREYIRESGMIKTICELGLEPKDTKSKLATCHK